MLARKKIPDVIPPIKGQVFAFQDLTYPVNTSFDILITPWDKKLKILSNIFK